MFFYLIFDPIRSFILVFEYMYNGATPIIFQDILLLKYVSYGVNYCNFVFCAPILRYLELMVLLLEWFLQLREYFKSNHVLGIFLKKENILGNSRTNQR
jgi:hypothetical protein